MGKANQTASVKNFGLFWQNGGRGFLLSSLYIPQAILVGLIIAGLIVAVFYWYFGTEHGSAIRATGSNPNMSRAQGIDIDRMKVLGLSLSNGMVALSGGLMTQFQGTADVSMGRGAIVIGLASVIIGEVLLGKLLRNFALRLAAVVVGAVIYYIVLQIVLQLGLNTNDLKLLSAAIVALFLAIPYWKSRAMSRNTKGGAAHA